MEARSEKLWWRRGGREFVHGFLAWVCSWVSMGLFMGFWRLGRIWVAFGWLDLGPLVVIFSDGLGDLFQWV